MENDARVELQLFRDKIIAEIERRMIVLQDVERRLTQAKFVYDKMTEGARSFSGSTARRQVENAHRMTLRKRLASLEREASEARADLERAQSRLQEVDDRLDELSVQER